MRMFKIHLKNSPQAPKTSSVVHRRALSFALFFSPIPVCPPPPILPGAMCGGVVIHHCSVVTDDTTAMKRCPRPGPLHRLRHSSCPPGVIATSWASADGDHRAGRVDPRVASGGR